MEEGVSYCLKNLPDTSFMHNNLFLALAYSKFAKVVLGDSLNIDSDLADADGLINTYLEKDDGSYKPEYAMPYFFAASQLTVISRLSNVAIVKKSMLSRSIEISKRGLLKAQDKSELLYSLNQALRELRDVCSDVTKCAGSP